MLRLVLPKGSLEQATLQLFEDADLGGAVAARTSTTGRRSTTRASPTCASCGRRRSRATSPTACSTSASPGRDWIEETGADVVTLDGAALLEGDRAARSRWCSRSRRTRRTGASTDLPAGVRVHTEYPELTRRYFEKHGVDAEVSLSYGATEAKVPEIADAVVEITETGRALRAAGLQGARHDPRVVHRADRQPGGLRRTRSAEGDGADPDAAQRCARSTRPRAGEAQRRARPASTP